jgi:hypothetical protein
MAVDEAPGTSAAVQAAGQAIAAAAAEAAAAAGEATGDGEPMEEADADCLDAMALLGNLAEVSAWAHGSCCMLMMASNAASGPYS